MNKLRYNKTLAFWRALVPAVTAAALVYTPIVQAWAAETPLNAAILAIVVAAASAIGVDLHAWQKTVALDRRWSEGMQHVLHRGNARESNDNA